MVSELEKFLEIYGYVDINIYDTKKIVLEQISYPPDNSNEDDFYDKDDYKRPLSRYGHTMPLLNNKLYVLGGEFKEWTKDKYKKDIM